MLQNTPGYKSVEILGAGRQHYPEEIGRGLTQKCSVCLKVCLVTERWLFYLGFQDVRERPFRLHVNRVTLLLQVCPNCYCPRNVSPVDDWNQVLRVAVSSYLNLLNNPRGDNAGKNIITGGTLPSSC